MRLGEQWNKTGGSCFVSKVLELKLGEENGSCFH